ncbi:MAG: glycosyltransferase family 4 protein [Clostridiales bacterium]|nr:glycosyltransferase family 4 protein [Clostridiales bacterium]
MVRPRILTVVRPVAGGIRVHVKHLLENLSNEFNFCVACPSELADDFTELATEIFPVPMGKTLNPAQDLAAVCSMTGKLRRETFDLVHAHGFKAGMVARMAARACRVPCLITVHNDFAHANVSQLRMVYLAAERYLSRWTTGYIAVSAWLAEELQGAYGVSPDRIVIIPNGIARPAGNMPLEEELPFPDNMPLVGTVARLAPQKGVEYFIRAVAKLQLQYTHTGFIIVGDGPLRGELESLARQLGLDGRIYFAGYRQDVPAILARIKIFVQPSLSEGQGITVLEAMSAGCPVVASATGGLKELIRHGENGLLVEPGDIEQLTDAVRLLLEDDKLAESLAKQAATVAERYDIRNMLESTRNTYYRVMKGGTLV